MGVFSTTNFSLAVTLATLGVPFAEPECPEWREITSEELEKGGWATVEDAEEAGFIGTISYGFADHPDRKAIINAFNKVHHSPKSARDIPDVLDFKGGKAKAIEAIAMSIAVAFRNRKKYADRRDKVRARLRLNKENGGYAIIDRRSDAKTKERLSQ